MKSLAAPPFAAGVLQMPAALEIIAGQATAPSSTFTALTMNTGDSLTVRNSAPTSDNRLIQAWAKHQAAGVLRIRSPRLHDNVQGIRIRNQAGSVIEMLPWDVFQKLYAQDQLIAEITGSAVGGQFEQAALMNYYSDLPGVAARLTTIADVQARGVNIFTQESQITPGVGGGYSGQAAINAFSDLMIQNTDYALLGYRVDARCTLVAIRGADTGNLRVGGPGEPAIQDVTENWFAWLSRYQNKALIPVFNSANKAGIFVDIMQDQAGSAVNISWFFVQLAPGALPTA